jgi:hypothetical protein
MDITNPDRWTAEDADQADPDGFLDSENNQ